MNVNIFFIFLGIVLLNIYLFFKPLDIQNQTFKDIPLFELKNFTLYELDKVGLITLMSGNETTKYSDRYIISSVNYTDNSKQNMMNMKANYGVYKDDNISLNGDIELYREDGFLFKTQSAIYNKKLNLVIVDENYTSLRGNDSFSGSSLKYYNVLDKIESKNVFITYQLEDSF